MQRLTSYVNQALAVADLRNLAVENPVSLRYQLDNGEVMIVVVAHLEPNNVTLPFNVTWIVADPDSPRYLHTLRRVSAEESAEFRNTWQVIATLDAMLEERQYWDTSNGMLLGEVDVPQVGAATPDVRGLARLNSVYTPDESRPVVVETNDSRNSNARPPAEHTHPVLPATMLHGAGGINAYDVKIATINDPMPGHILTLTNTAGEYALGMWRRPTASDIKYDGPVLESLEIVGPPSATLNEQQAFTFKANAVFDDASRIENVQVDWLIVGNAQKATIGGTSGNFMSLDVDQTEVVRVQASWTQPETGTRVTQFLDVSILDVTEYLTLERIEIIGQTEVNERETTSYSVRAFFSDGTDSGVTPVTFTSSNPNAGTFTSSTGVLVVGELSEDHTTVLSATYLYRGVTKSATLSVNVRDLTIYPESAEVVGPDNVEEGSVANFILRVTLTDGTKLDLAESDWSSSNEQAGAIDGSGTFTAAEDILEDISTTLNASYSLEGRTVYATKQIVVKDMTVYPRSAKIIGSQRITEGATHTFQMSVKFSDNSETIVTADAWTLDNPLMGVISTTTGQFQAVPDVEADVVGNITATYERNGSPVSATMEITVTDETNYPTSAAILGSSSMDEDTAQTLQFEVTYQDGTKVVETVSDWSSSNTSAATINSVTGVLTAVPNLTVDQVTNVSATFFAHGRTVDATLAITVRDSTNYPISAVISGPATIDESNQADYTMTVRFADQTEANRSAVWTLNGPGTVNANGRVTAPANVDANVTTKLNASFTLDGVTVSAAPKTITFIDTTVYPVTARILGGNQITEGESRTYQLEVTFSNSERSVVPVTNWASSNSDAGEINASSGSFHAKDVTGTQTTTITASHTSNGRTVGAEATITVLDTTNYPVSAAIIGPLEVDEGGQATYALHVTYTDGAVVPVQATDWTSSVESTGVIHPVSGLFTAAANLNADSTTALRATYESHGTTVEGNITVTVKDQTVYPISAVVEGPALIDSLGAADYILRVTFEDQTSAVHPATWTSSNLVAGAIDDEGHFVAEENVSGVNLATTLKGTFTLDGRTVEATKSVAVRDLTNYPTSVTITGVSSIDSSGTGGANTTMFKAAVKYTDGTTVPDKEVTWTVQGVNPSDEIGNIDSSGLFTTNPVMTGNTRNITVRASYEEHGRVVNSTKTVSVTVIPFPVSLRITGAASVGSETTNTYVAHVTDSKGVESTPSATFTTDAISTVATISQVGVLVARRLSEDTTVTITATYESNGTTVSNTFQVAIAKVVNLTRIEVAGADTLDSGNTELYTVQAFYDNGTDEDVTDSAGYEVIPASAGSFDVVLLGKFTAAHAAEDTPVELKFSFTYNGETKFATKTVTVIAPQIAGNSQPRYGVAMFADTDFTGGKDPEGDIFKGTPYTRWTGVQHFCDTVMTNLIPIEGGDCHFDIGESKYGYLMYPKSLTTNPSGRASIRSMPMDMEGGMGGAMWTPEEYTPEDPFDLTQFDGIEVQYDSGDGSGLQTWVIHRTDWPHLGEVIFRISF